MTNPAASGAILIFDLDGTLFHTETVTVPAAREAFAAHGLHPPADAEICSFIGKTSDQYNAWLRSLCPAPTADKLLKAAADRELELISERGRLYPGIPEALARLRGAAATLAVCSNGSGRYVEAVLAAHGIGGHFDAVRYRRPGDSSKPQMLRELLARIRSDRRQPGIVVGDRHDDVEAAHANGLRAVGCAYGYGADGELDAADAVAQSPSQLAASVTRLLSGPGPQGGPANG